MNKKMQKGIVAAVAATMANGIVAPVFAASAETTDLASKYAKAYEATASAKTQKELTAARVLVDALYTEVKGTANEYLATTLSSILDKPQQKNLEALDLAIKAADATPTQAKVNEARALLVDMPEVWAKAFSSYVDGIQDKVTAKVVDAIKAAQASGVQADLDEAKKLYEELLTVTNNVGVKSWAEVALKAELDKVVVVAKVDSVSVVGVKSVKVAFNQPVDTTKAVFKLKKGAAVYGTTVAWNAAKTEATLTTVVSLPAADYAVEVSGLTDAAITKTFTVAAEVASKIEVVSKTVSLSDSAKIEFKVSNQYGEDMKINGTTTGVVVSAYNTTQKRVEALTNATADNKLTFSATFASAGAPAKLNDVIRVTVAYAGLTAQANVTVVDPANTASIAFGDIAPLKDKVRISVSETGFEVPYTMFDQYGTAVKLAAHTANADGVADIETVSGVQFISSKPAVVDVDTFAVDANGKLTFNTGATEGTAVITAIINATGAVSTFTVNVNKTPIVDALEIAAPTALIAAGESVKLDVIAADQFGGAIAAKDITGVTVTSSDTTVVANGSTITAGKLNVTTLAAGTTVLTAKVGTKVVGSVTVVVEAEAKATEVKSITFGPKFELGAKKTLTTSDFVVIDQYGRTMDKTGIAFTVAEKTAADTQFDIVANEFEAKVLGSSTMVLTATDSNGVSAAAYEFTLTAIASSDITSYAITPVATIYGAGTHAKALELVGKTSAGETVVLKANKVTAATSSDTSKATVAVASGVATVTGVAAAEGNTVIALWNGATKLAETTVTVSKVAPVITSVKFNSTVETTLALGGTTTLSDNLEVKDQYGVAIAGNGFWTTSDSTKATVSAAGLVTEGTAVAGDTVTIGYVAENGMMVTTVLTVQ